MALDGATLYFIKNDLEQMTGARVDRIHQPSREEVVITLRHRSGSVKLLINVSAVSSRIHFTEVTLENPKTPPMFCMLLRKHLGSGKLVSVRQLSMDRVLFLDFETMNDLGDLVHNIHPRDHFSEDSISEFRSLGIQVRIVFDIDKKLGGGSVRLEARHRKGPAQVFQTIL